MPEFKELGQDSRITSRHSRIPNFSILKTLIIKVKKVKRLLNPEILWKVECYATFIKICLK